MNEQYLVKVWTAVNKDAILPASAAFKYARTMREQGHTVSCELWRLSKKILEQGQIEVMVK